MARKDKRNFRDREIGQKVRLYRSIAGLSQHDIAARIGVSYQQLHKYERGENKISAQRLEAISKILGVPVSTFFASTHGRISEEENTEEEELTHFFRGISSGELRQLLLHSARVFAELSR